MGGRAGKTRGIILRAVGSPGKLVEANVNGPSYQCLLKANAAGGLRVLRGITFCTCSEHTHHTRDTHLKHTTMVLIPGQVQDGMDPQVGGGG